MLSCSFIKFFSQKFCLTESIHRFLITLLCSYLMERHLQYILLHHYGRENLFRLMFSNQKRRLYIVVNLYCSFGSPRGFGCRLAPRLSPRLTSENFYVLPQRQNEETMIFVSAGYIILHQLNQKRMGCI